MRDERRMSRRQWFGFSAAAAAVLLSLVAVLLSSYARNAPLRRDGLVSADAQVLDVDRNRRRSDEVKVSFTGPDRTVVADIPVRGSFSAGETVDVLYDPTEPSLVRTVDGWTPAYATIPLLIYVGLAMVLLAVGLVAAIRTPRPDGGVTRADEADRQPS